MTATTTSKKTALSAWEKGMYHQTVRSTTTPTTLTTTTTPRSGVS
jgi:hypothetical protein